MKRQIGSWARGLAGAAALAVLAPAAQAAVVLNYTDFTGTCGTSLSCVGSTGVAGTALRLTPSAANQSGAGYSTTAIALGANATFSTTFQFRITQNGGIAPADGLTFVVAGNATGLGSFGGGLGYQGVGNSVAIEFDTFFNGGAGEPNSNHVGIDVNGSINSVATATPYGVTSCATLVTGAGCMSNGSIWTATISYDGTTNLLDVFLQEGSGAVQQLFNGYSIDIGAALGTSTAFVGFTSGTGSGFGNHDILSWQLANDTSITPPTGDVAEPGSLALAGLALAALGGLRRRR